MTTLLLTGAALTEVISQIHVSHQQSAHFLPSSLFPGPKPRVGCGGAPEDQLIKQPTGVWLGRASWGDLLGWPACCSLAQLCCEAWPSLPAGLWKVVAWLSFFFSVKGKLNVSPAPSPGGIRGGSCADRPPGLLARVAGSFGRPLLCTD